MFVWSAFVFFFLAFGVRIFRCWVLMRGFRVPLLSVAAALVFSAVITVATGSSWVGGLAKVVLLGMLFTSFFVPSLLAVIYTRFYDFLVLGLAFCIFGDDFSTMLPWVIVSFVMTLLIGGFFAGLYFFGYRLPERIYTPSIFSRFRQMTVKSMLSVFLFSILIWVFEALGLFFLLTTLHYPMVWESVIRGLMSYIVGLAPFLHGAGGAMVWIKQLQYESFEVPLLFFAAFFSLVLLRLWVMPDRKVHDDF